MSQRIGRWPCIQVGDVREQIGRRENAKDSSTLKHRHTADVIVRKYGDRLAQRRVWRGGGDICRHYVLHPEHSSSRKLEVHDSSRSAGGAISIDHLPSRTSFRLTLPSIKRVSRR